jgi:hypothetical protein
MAILVITRWYISCIAFSGQIRLQFDLASPSNLEGEGPIHLETTTQPFFKPQKKWLVLFIYFIKLYDFDHRYFE